jgi:hypothetical protein
VQARDERAGGVGVPVSSSVKLRRALLLAAALAAASGCRKHAEGPKDAGAEPTPPAQEQRLFTLADLAAATRLDARVQRLIALTGEYKLALTFDRGPRLAQHTDLVAKRLDEALPAAERALQDLRDTRDLAIAGAILSVARRWPALLRAARDELMSSPTAPTAAANALAAADDEMARALEAYRAFRTTWRITDSPGEPEAVLEFLRARRELEAAEADWGRRLREGAGVANAAGQGAARAAIAKVVGDARTAAGKVDAGRRGSAQRLVDAEEQALTALAGMAAPAALEEQRERDALSYQIAKVNALEAIADYVALTAKGSPDAGRTSKR